MRTARRLKIVRFENLAAVLLVVSMGVSHADERDPAMRIIVERAVTPLNGPWRFHIGDDSRWSSPDFDDSQWETVDLTPEPGAHDSDVGLTNYVRGWWVRGHQGYVGFAWYRARISIHASPGVEVAILAPAYVEDAYQFFWNDKLIGGSGDFAKASPAIYSTKPQLMRVPPSDPGQGDTVIAIRVWMSPGMEREPDGGGMHIAPKLGEAEAIDTSYQVQWLETVRGYIVDVMEPAAFALLALLAWRLAQAERARTFHTWLSAALLLTAALRANQALYFWTSHESLSTYLVVRSTILEPLGLAVWVMTWRSWFRLNNPPWFMGAIVALTALTMVQSLAGDPVATTRWIPRAMMAVIFLTSFVAGVRRREPDRWLAVVAMVLVGTGQFADELLSLHVPGIWFPWGTGVSRTQFAYAGLIAVLSVLLIRRITRIAVGSRDSTLKD
ncbi:MAG: glycoside hydrolase [Chthoniobacterales bacterium]|nr:glycoside hydrolase [Chthoniobacterales bacterium]